LADAFSRAEAGELLIDRMFRYNIGIGRIDNRRLKMTYDVILSKHNNKYVARVKEWPEVVVEEQSRESAIDQIKERLVEYLTHQVEVVQIEITPPLAVDNPWLKNFGRFQDDPTFAELEAEISAYRQILAEEEAKPVE
jgi:predicted RNase H-like HicB family nuclease